jgi:hypothetical protein
MRAVLSGAALAIALGACTDRELIVESNTDWSGFIDEEESGYSRDGSGNARFDLDNGRICWTFQKETDAGVLRVYAKTKEIFGTDRQGDASTTAAYGFVTGCAE